MAPSPESVLPDALSILQGGAAPLKLLVAAADLSGIDANATRAAVTRLLAAGPIERDERGAYRTARPIPEPFTTSYGARLNDFPFDEAPTGDTERTGGGQCGPEPAARSA